MVDHEKIVIHDARDPAPLIEFGILPSGGKLIVDKLAVGTDLPVAEGFIEPHFFAGFPGGRKSVSPGIASRDCNHAMLRAMKFEPASSIDEARVVARKICGADARIAVIPDGVSVIVEKA